MSAKTPITVQISTLSFRFALFSLNNQHFCHLIDEAECQRLPLPSREKVSVSVPLKCHSNGVCGYTLLSGILTVKEKKILFLLDDLIKTPQKRHIFYISFPVFPVSGYEIFLIYILDGLPLCRGCGHDSEIKSRCHFLRFFFFPELNAVNSGV